MKYLKQSLIILIGVMIFNCTSEQEMNYLIDTDHELADKEGLKALSDSLSQLMPSMYNGQKYNTIGFDKSLLSTKDSVRIRIDNHESTLSITKEKDSLSNVVFWEGHGQNGEEMSIQKLGGSYLGTIYMNEKQYELRTEDSLSYVVEIDELKLRTAVDTVDTTIIKPYENFIDNPDYLDGVEILETKIPVIKVLVVYSREALKAVNYRNSRLNEVINGSVNQTNRAFNKSGVLATLKLVKSVLSPFKESGNIYTDLNTLKRSSAVSNLRRTHKADIVVLIVENSGGNTAGVANMPSYPSTRFKDSHAFAVVVRDQAYSNKTFAHEVGHILGADHNCEDANSRAGINHGFNDCSSRFKTRTIMAYQRCSDRRIVEFSNARRHRGAGCKFDNTRTINRFAPFVAKYRLDGVKTPNPIYRCGRPICNFTVNVDARRIAFQNFRFTIGRTDDFKITIDDGDIWRSATNWMNYTGARSGKKAPNGYVYPGKVEMALGMKVSSGSARGDYVGTGMNQLLNQRLYFSPRRDYRFAFIPNDGVRGGGNDNGDYITVNITVYTNANRAASIMANDSIREIKLDRSLK